MTKMSEDDKEEKTLEMVRISGFSANKMDNLKVGSLS